MSAACRSALLIGTICGVAQLPGSAPASARTDDAPGLSKGLQRSLHQVCGGCHDSARDSAKPGALAVFDLRDPDWLEDLSARQRTSALGRFEGKDVPDEHKAELARVVRDLR